MLEIRTTGFEDFLDGSANIKTLIIGGPGAGKTRYSSFWPNPFFIDCEDGRGSIADRAVPYVRVRSSKDMLDTLEYLKSLERTPKAQRRHQTVVVDTADSFQRIVKEEWVTQTKSGSFSGFDAWGYLDTKMQLLFTRLLNLDYNVVVLVHYKDKTYKDGDNTVRELTLQLQGAIADQIFNDFGLVGWMGTYWEAGEEGRVQKRGLTFQPTPEKPFLKDRFHVTPPWMEVRFDENDYQQLWQAFSAREDLEEIPEVQSVGEVPDHEAVRLAAGQVAPPVEGGPVAARPAADVPLEKQSKEQLTAVAKDLGLSVRGNALKSEILAAIQAAQAAPTTSASSTSSSQPAEPQTSATASTASPAPSEPATASPSVPDAAPSAAATAATEEERSTPTSPPTEQKPTPPAAQPEAAQPPAESTSPDSDAVQLVKQELGAEVISETTNDTPATQPAVPPATSRPAAAPRGPSTCADCGTDLAPEWADPVKKNAVRMSFIKHRRYLCSSCVGEAA